MAVVGRKHQGREVENRCYLRDLWPSLRRAQHCTLCKVAAAPGCFCNGGVPWSSREGHARCLSMLEGRYGEQYDASRMDWGLVERQYSRDWVEDGRDLHEMWASFQEHHIEQSATAQCACMFLQQGLPWSSREGHALCLSMLEGRYGEQYDASRMDWAWWRDNIHGIGSKMDVTCTKCGHRSKSTTLNSLQQDSAPACFCNRGVPWSQQGKGMLFVFRC